ncbi:hypothetical protein Mal4_02860 [Maioricimonas rarisocia]|uniref:Uncharacterized protein n=1 Tax=Maioricimonas rarisocia TaxID=2528026 RepID=A0A517Z0L6_9PLAN|nr:hypothetical protein Mal4_02860 [Maioricimonas rarisocia]
MWCAGSSQTGRHRAFQAHASCRTPPPRPPVAARPRFENRGHPDGTSIDQRPTGRSRRAFACGVADRPSSLASRVSILPGHSLALRAGPATSHGIRIIPELTHRARQRHRRSAIVRRCLTYGPVPPCLRASVVPLPAPSRSRLVTHLRPPRHSLALRAGPATSHGIRIIPELTHRARLRRRPRTSQDSSLTAQDFPAPCLRVSVPPWWPLPAPSRSRLVRRCLTYGPSSLASQVSRLMPGPVPACPSRLTPPPTTPESGPSGRPSPPHPSRSEHPSPSASSGSHAGRRSAVPPPTATRPAARSPD